MRKYCFFCRKFKPDVRRLRLRFGEIHVCNSCAKELILMIEEAMADDQGSSERE